MKKSLQGVALVGVAVLALAACGSKPTTAGGSSPSATGSESAGSSMSASSTGAASSSSSAAAGANFKACMVSDTGGFDDKSFNQTSLKGLTDAQSSLGIQVAKAESKSSNDYSTNLNGMVQQGCKLIVSVGFDLENATDAAAKANPNVKFAIVDSAPSKPITNLKPLLFDTAQASFLGGYVAAGMSKSGIVGTFGGEKIPSVTVYMDGFVEGVNYYNKQKNKTVKVLGWDETKQTGLFTNDFTDPSKGKTNAQNLITQGADVILPVAGNDGQGALQAAKASGGKVTAVWVDTDGCVSVSQYCGSIITSVYKGLDVAVTNEVKSAMNGSFSNTPYIGTLKNSGVGITSYHDFDSKVPADLKSEVSAIQKQIVAGTIKITSPNQPKSS